MNDFFNDHQKQNLRGGKVVIKAICKYIWMISHSPNYTKTLK